MTPKHAYVTAHDRIRRVRGKASARDCVTCGRQAHDWAYNHEQPDPQEIINEAGLVYSDDPSYYTPMCRKCHRQFDVGYNLIMDRGKKKCRECGKARSRRYYHAHKEAAA